VEGQGFFGAGLSFISFFLRYKVPTIPSAVSLSGALFGFAILVIEVVLPEMRPPLSALALYCLAFLAFGAGVYLHQESRKPMTSEPKEAKPAAGATNDPIEGVTKLVSSFFKIGAGAVVDGLKIKGVRSDQNTTFDVSGTLKNVDLQDFDVRSQSQNAPSPVFVKEMTIGRITYPPPEKVGNIQPSGIRRIQNPDGTTTETFDFTIDEGVTLNNVLVGIKGVELIGFSIFKDKNSVPTMSAEHDGFSIQKISPATGTYQVVSLRRSVDQPLHVGFDYN
jgi:hypothetical protein